MRVTKKKNEKLTACNKILFKYIQSDSPSMITAMFHFDNEIIRIIIFRILQIIFS